MSGIPSTNNNLQFGDAKGHNVSQCQTNSGNIGQDIYFYDTDGALTHGDKSGSRSDCPTGDYVKVGLPVEGATEDQISANFKNSKMVGILSTNNNLKFGDAIGHNVNRCQTNSGNIGRDINFYNTDGALTHCDKSGSSSDCRTSDYVKVGLPVEGATEDQISANFKNSNMGGILSTNNNLKFGDAKGNNVKQYQTNSGNIGHDINFYNTDGAVTHRDKSASSNDCLTGDYVKVGLPVERATEDQISANFKNSEMGRILSTNNHLKFGDAKGHNVNQCQTNSGNIGHDINFYDTDVAVTHGDKSGSDSDCCTGDYVEVGLPVEGYPILENQKMLSDKQPCGIVNYGDPRVPVDTIVQKIDLCMGDRGGDGGHSFGGGYAGPGGPCKGSFTINHNSAEGKH